MPTPAPADVSCLLTGVVSVASPGSAVEFSLGLGPPGTQDQTVVEPENKRAFVTVERAIGRQIAVVPALVAGRQRAAQWPKAVDQIVGVRR